MERGGQKRRMEELGVRKMRYLSCIPVLVAVLAVTVWLRLPLLVQRDFMPRTGLMTSPLSGVAVPATSDPAAEPGAKLAYARVTWRELEPERGEFDFEGVERRNHFEQWRAMGARIILNFCMDEPGGEPMDLPDWLYELTEGQGERYARGGERGFSPAYANSALRDCHREAVLRLGERYDGDGLLMAVEMGSIGHDGLWDMSGVSEPLPGASVMADYAQDYADAFQRTELTCPARYDAFAEMGIGCLNPDASNSAASWEWLNRGEYGGYDRRIRQEVSAAAPERTGGVWAAHVPEGLRLADMDTAGYEALLLALKTGGASYLYGADLTDLNEDRLSSLNAALGYRLWIRRVRLPETAGVDGRLRIDVSWQNDGVCAMPVNWPVEVALYRGGICAARQIADVDVRDLGTGATEGYLTLDIGHGVEPGAYSVTVAVLDPDTGEPAVDLAMECPRIDGRCAVGEVEIR